MAQITEELKALDRAALKDTDWDKEWAGEYYDGDGLGRNFTIRLAPKSGIAATNYGCLGFYGGDHGTIVEVLPDGLKIKPVLGADNYGMLDERLYFVRWGDRRYLVPEYSMMKLVNNYNEGGFARSGMYSIPRLHTPGASYHGYDAAPDGKPALPAKYAKLLHDTPITLKVTKLSKIVKKGVTTGVQGYFADIEFDGGAENGVYEGLEFKYGKFAVGVTTGTIRVDHVDLRTCTGKLTAFGGPDQTFTPPALGEQVSTAAPKFEAPSIEELMAKPKAGEKPKADPAQPSKAP